MNTASQRKHSILILFGREQLTGRPTPTGPLLRITRNRHVFRAVLTAAVVLGIVSATQTNNDGSTSATSRSLYKVSTIIFLVLTVLQAFQTLVLVWIEIAGEQLLG